MTTSDELVEPAYFTSPDWHKTLGPEVGELATIAGFPPDPEQQMVLDAMFGMDRHGRFVAFEVAIIACRQNLKTGLLKQAAIGKTFLMERGLFVWSAHEFSTAQEGFRDLRILIESTPTLDRMVKRIHMASGAEAIELRGGQRIKFKARTKAGGRGLTGDDVALDEGFALMPEHVGALMPTLSTKPDPQVLYASSAGLEKSEVLRAIRDRGRVGTGRLVYAEWCAPEGCETPECMHDVGTPGCRMDDESAWQAANPQLGRRISLEYVKAERDALPVTEFGRERLGWWDEPPGDMGEAFGDGKWADCAVEMPLEPPKPAAIGIAVSIDREWASIGAASSGPRTHLGSVDRRRGTAWLLDEAERIQREHGCKVVIDGRGPAANLIPDLRARHIRFRELSTAEYLDACVDLFDAVVEKRVEHANYSALNAAVGAAKRRDVGDRWAWARKSGDVSMLEAVTLARTVAATAQPTQSFAF